MKADFLPMRPVDSSLLEAMESYLRHRHDIKERSKDCYRDGVRRFVKFVGRDQIKDLSGEVVDQYVVSIADHRTMARLDTIALRLLSRWLAEEKILSADPLATVCVPKRVYKRREELPDEAVPELIKASAESVNCVRDHAIILLGLSTGLRPNEMRQLELGDIDLRKGFVRVREETSKTPEGHRIVPLDPQVVAALDSYIHDHRPKKPGHLFLTEDGEPFKEGGWAKLFYRIAKRLRDRGVQGFTAYRMRHTAITNWRRAGIHPSDMQQLAGHKNFQTTQGYIGKKRPDELLELPRAFSQIYGRVA